MGKGNHWLFSLTVSLTWSQVLPVTPPFLGNGTQMVDIRIRESMFLAPPEVVNQTSPCPTPQRPAGLIIWKGWCFQG